MHWSVHFTHIPYTHPFSFNNNIKKPRSSRLEYYEAYEACDSYVVHVIPYLIFPYNIHGSSSFTDPLILVAWLKKNANILSTRLSLPVATPLPLNSRGGAISHHRLHVDAAPKDPGAWRFKAVLKGVFY